MFSEHLIKSAKKRINADNKAYLTSDNCLHIINRNESIDGLIKHCSDNSLSLLDVEENKEIEFKVKKKNAATES